MERPDERSKEGEQLREHHATSAKRSRSIARSYPAAQRKEDYSWISVFVCTTVFAPMTFTSIRTMLAHTTLPTAAAKLLGVSPPPRMRAG